MTLFRNAMPYCSEAWVIVRFKKIYFMTNKVSIWLHVHCGIHFM